jgi:hypothetical protein
MAQAPIWQWSAVSTAAAIRAGKISSVEVVKAHLLRMKAANPAINAVVVDLGGDAVKAARAADRAQAKGATLGPLHGVPVTVKINIDLTGQANSNGVPAFAGNIAPGDSPVVANLKKAGAVIIGMTNTPEFSMRAFTAARPDAEPVGPRRHLRRLVRRGRCLDRGRYWRAGARQRHRRLAALARLLQRHRHHQAHPGPHPRVQPERRRGAAVDGAVHVLARPAGPRGA